jgi:hypothetical protein
MKNEPTKAQSEPNNKPEPPPTPPQEPTPDPDVIAPDFEYETEGTDPDQLEQR